MARLIAVPILVALMLAARDDAAMRWAACVLFVAGLATDYWDGWLARRHNLITPFGKLVDPIADKALTGAALLGLVWLHVVPWWLAVVILVREVGVTVLRGWLVRRYGEAGVLPAERSGKIKTVLQGVSLSWLLLPWPAGGVGEGLGLTALAVAAVVTLTSGAVIVRSAVRIVRQS